MMPIPTDQPVPPIVGVLFVIAATVGLVVGVIAVVRWWRNRDDDHHDVFGPPAD